MSSEQSAALIEVLSERQARERLSDRRMAARLGVSPSQWHRLKRGERSISVQVLQSAIQEFGITGTVIDFLAGELPVPN